MESLPANLSRRIANLVPGRRDRKSLAGASRALRDAERLGDSQERCAASVVDVLTKLADGDPDRLYRFESNHFVRSRGLWHEGLLRAELLSKLRSASRERRTVRLRASVWPPTYYRPSDASILPLVVNELEERLERLPCIVPARRQSRVRIRSFAWPLEARLRVDFAYRDGETHRTLLFAGRPPTKPEGEAKKKRARRRSFEDGDEEEDARFAKWGRIDAGR